MIQQVLEAEATKTITLSETAFAALEELRQLLCLDSIEEVPQRVRDLVKQQNDFR